MPPLQEIQKNKQTKSESLTFLRMLDQNNKEKVLEYAVLKFGAQIRVLPSSDLLLSGDEVAFYPTTLRLIPSESQVQVGDQMDVFILLDNPDQVTFDAVALYLRYDPRVLKVIDSDNNNWITEGINIHDGDYQKDFNLEFCRANQVNPDQGEIVYSMETFHEPISASGVFARIRFEAIRPVRSTSILYGFKFTGSFSDNRDF